MASSRSKSSYPVVTFVILALTTLGVVSTALKSVQPLPEPNGLQNEADSFLSRAKYQKIEWKRWGKPVLAEAKRQDKPILLVLGTESSKSARLFDDFTLSLQETADVLGDQFIFARQDIWSDPALCSILLPLNQARGDFDPSFQIWILDSSGRPFFLKIPKNDEQFIDMASLQWSVRTALRQLDAFNRDPGGQAAPGSQQLEERNALLSPTDLRFCSEDSHIKWLSESMDERTGTWPEYNSYRIYPMAWQFLLENNEPELLAKSTRAILASGMIDWVEGGVFVRASRPGWQQKEYDKYTFMNVEFAAVMAKLASSNGQLIQRRIAEDTFDFVVNNMVRDSLLLPYIVNNPGMLNRNVRTSTSVKQLSSNFSPEEQSTLVNVLNLDVQKNSEMIPSIATNQIFLENQPKIDELLSKLKNRSASFPKRLAPVAYCEDSAYGIARLFETARLLDDAKRIAIVDDLFVGLTQFQLPGHALKRSENSSILVESYLGDYLAMADAYWERFLVFGIDDDAKESFEWFNQARIRFATEQKGVLQQTSIIAEGNYPPDTDLPQIVDSFKESTAAGAIRLSWQLGNYFFIKSLDSSASDPHKLDLRQRANSLRSFAEDSILNYGAIANSVNSRTSGLFRASQIVRKDLFVYINGAGSHTIARKLMVTTPTANVFFSSENTSGIQKSSAQSETKIRAFRGWQLLPDFKITP